jgi:hypothetical protein
VFGDELTALAKKDKRIVLSSGQSFSSALSWIPTESGSYTATAFVWESVDNPTALSPPVSTTITVQ